MHMNAEVSKQKPTTTAEKTTKPRRALEQTTLDNLSTAMHGEAFAYAKYLLYAERAHKSGNKELADLFEKNANTERFEHFAEEAELAGLVGSDADNLRDAIKGESYEIDIMYLEFAGQARVPEILPRPLVLKKFVMTRSAIGMHSRVRSQSLAQRLAGGRLKLKFCSWCVAEAEATTGIPVGGRAGFGNCRNGSADCAGPILARVPTLTS
jgi:rubrerythrin